MKEEAVARSSAIFRVRFFYLDRTVVEDPLDFPDIETAQSYAEVELLLGEELYAHSQNMRVIIVRFEIVERRAIWTH